MPHTLSFWLLLAGKGTYCCSTMQFIHSERPVYMTECVQTRDALRLRPKLRFGRILTIFVSVGSALVAEAA